MAMKKLLLSALLLGLAADVAGIAVAQVRRRDQDEAYADTRRGQVKPLREIEAHVVPQMGAANYLGPEYDSASARYRLKFMRAGSVIWVDGNAARNRATCRTGPGRGISSHRQIAGPVEVERDICAF
jgi:hypothetical protein